MRKPIVFVIRHKSKMIFLTACTILVTTFVILLAKPIIISVLGPSTNRVIVIDPGHGGIDGGANCEGFLEKDINLAIALKVKTILQKSRIKVILTREKDMSLNKQYTETLSRQRKDLLARIGIIKKYNPDFFLSIHVNANPRRPATTGPMVFYNPSVPASPYLAEIIQQNLNETAAKQGFKKHDARKADYFLLKQAPYPGAIIEVGFMTNKKEKQLLETSDYQQQVANAIAKSVLQYYSSQSKGSQTDASNSIISTISSQSRINVFFPEKNKDTLGSESIPLYQAAVSDSNELPRSLRTAVKALISGPSNPHLEPVFNPQAEILNVRINDGIATLNFSKKIIPQSSASYEEYLGLSALVETVCQFPGVNCLRILIDGQKTDTFGEHFDISKVLTPEKPKIRIAIVIDDLASSNQGLDEMMSLNRPLTMAVMPKLENSRKTAELVHKKGFEVFLHIPMEPEAGKSSWLGAGAITSGMTPEETAKQVLEDLLDVPHVTGMNNHMGSKITKRKDLMLEVLKIAKSKHLIFLDSRTTQDTVVPLLATQLNIPLLERSVFLDEINSVHHVKKQIKEAAKIAKEKGSAIAIGHVGITGKNTAQGLKEMVPWIEEQGIELVFASQLIRNLKI